MTLRLVRTSRRPRWPLWAIAVMVAWGGLVAVTVSLAQASGRRVSLCLFKLLSGLPCPTCGLTRGTLSMLRGHIIDGWTLNPLVFSLLAVAAAAVAMRALFGRKLVLRLSRRERFAAVAVLIVLVLANWAYVIRYVG